MKRLKSIKEVLNESNLSENDHKLYSDLLQKELSLIKSEHNSPWFTRIIIIAGSWLGSLLFLGFLVIVQLVNSKESFILFGSTFILTGIVLSHVYNKKHLYDSISFSLSILGQIMFGIGIWKYTAYIKPVCYAGIVVETLIYLLAQSYTQKFISVILIPFCLLGIIWNSRFFETTNFLIGALSVASVFIWTNEIRLQIWLKKHRYFYVPTAYGLVVNLLLLLILSINIRSFEVNISYWYIASLFSFLSLSFLLYNSLCRNLGLGRNVFWLTIGVIAIVLSPTVQSPGIITSLMIIVLAFERGNPVLLILGILFLAIYIISFYLSLRQTLLIKSIILMSTGVLFLGMYSVLAIVKKKRQLHEN